MSAAVAISSISIGQRHRLRACRDLLGPCLKSHRAELARLVDATFRCADDAGAAGLWTFVDRLAHDVERHR